MAKISTYAISAPVVDDDKWIGTDASALQLTKNFTARDVAIYLNNFDKVDSDSLRYVFQNWETGDVRKSGSISFSTSCKRCPKNFCIIFVCLTYYIILQQRYKIIYIVV